MLRLGLFLSLCAVARSAKQCPLIDTSRASAPNWGLRNCTYFRSDACCNAAEVEMALGPSMAQAGLMLEAIDIEPSYSHLQCRNHLDYMMCFFCSPKQGSWSDANGRVTVCAGFCNRIYTACERARWRGKRLHDLYANGKAFCEAQNFVVKAVGTDGYDAASLAAADTGACFGATSEHNYAVGAAASLRPNGALAAALGAALGALLLAGGGMADNYALPSLPRLRRRRGGGSLAAAPPLLLLLVGLAMLRGAAAAPPPAMEPFEGSCPYFNYRSATPQWGLRNCTWFKPSSCCLPGEEASLAAAVDALSQRMFHTSARCQQAMNFLGCWPCHPEQATFYDALHREVTLCPRLCDAMHAECKTAMWGGRKVAEAFADGRAFCAGLKLKVAPAAAAAAAAEKAPAAGAAAKALVGCLDVSPGMFMGKEWCDLPVDPLKSAATRGGGAPDAAAQLLWMVLLAVLALGQQGGAAATAISAAPAGKDEEEAEEEAGQSEQGGGHHRRLAASCSAGRRSAPSPPPPSSSSSARRAVVGLLCTAVAAHGAAVPMPALTVEGWAAAIGADLSALAHTSGLHATAAQRIYDSANYTRTDMGGAARVAALKQRLASWFKQKEVALELLHAEVTASAHALLGGKSSFPPQPSLPAFLDRDDPATFPPLAFDERFKSNVTQAASSVKVPVGVYAHQCGASCGGQNAAMPQDARAHIKLSNNLESRMRSNLANDTSLRWQYMGFQSGVSRFFPGAQEMSNHFGMPYDYDPRSRPWYLSAASGSKDVVIVIDCSAGMRQNGRLARARAAAKLILTTLSKTDYVNVICASGPAKDHCSNGFASSNDNKGYCPTRCESTPRFTEALGCVPGAMFPGTSSVVNDLSERIDDMQVLTWLRFLVLLLTRDSLPTRFNSHFSTWHWRTSTCRRAAPRTCSTPWARPKSCSRATSAAAARASSS
jgi:hypothetical protein